MKRGAADIQDRIRKIVLIAGKKSHGPDDNGIHDYPAQIRFIEYALKTSSVGKYINTIRAEDDRWPAEAVREADCIVVISDGRDGDLPYMNASHIASQERIKDMDFAVSNGAGVVPIHFALFTPEADMQRVLQWQGAAFEWERDGKRDWSSAINWATSELKKLCDSPILNGVNYDEIHEEFYHKLRFHPAARPLLAATALPGESSKEQTVAWSFERENSGRSFGTSMVHSLDKLRYDSLRTLVLNGIVWSAGLDVPKEGLRVPYAEREDVNYFLEQGPEPAPIRVSILAGNSEHRWHKWPETTGAMLDALGDDKRINTRVFTDPEDLVAGLQACDVLILNWVNWKDPLGMPEESKIALQKFTQRGGGVFVHHFSNGACHSSLPEASESDWPWFYEKLVRRIWDHNGASKHDSFGKFVVKFCSNHPLVAELDAFEVEDELYFNQHGELPVEVLMTAKSKISNKDEPLLWSYEVEKSRVVQCLLGHSAKTYEAYQMKVLLRRIVAWCARRQIHGGVSVAKQKRM